MTRTDSASKLVEAAPAAIYQALTRADARLRWLPPTGMTGRFESFDPRVGGGYRMVLTYKDPASTSGKTSPDSDVVNARFAELTADERIVELVDFETDDTDLTGTMTMTWALTTEAGGTRVTITADDVPDGIDPADHDAGLRSSLDQLAAYVE
jgi:uncharacterized protein YndB with AHSA1/START domain